ncbi:hypothetical protein BGX31_004675, partial [Mortierella sp. GBA43]
MHYQELSRKNSGRPRRGKRGSKRMMMQRLQQLQHGTSRDCPLWKNRLTRPWCIPEDTEAIYRKNGEPIRVRLQSGRYCQTQRRVVSTEGIQLGPRVPSDSDSNVSEGPSSDHDQAMEGSGVGRAPSPIVIRAKVLSLEETSQSLVPPPENRTAIENVGNSAPGNTSTPPPAPIECVMHKKPDHKTGTIEWQYVRADNGRHVGIVPPQEAVRMLRPKARDHNPLSYCHRNGVRYEVKHVPGYYSYKLRRRFDYHAEM